MAEKDVLRKTAKGEAEIAGKTSSISMKHRSLLVMVDGKLSEGDYIGRLKAMGDVAALINDLETNGYIDRKPGAAPPVKVVDHPAVAVLNMEARTYMAQFMYNLMGPEGETLAVRLERCKNNKELTEMLDVCRETITSIGMPDKAEEFSSAVKNMLA